MATCYNCGVVADFVALLQLLQLACPACGMFCRNVAHAWNCINQETGYMLRCHTKGYTIADSKDPHTEEQARATKKAVQPSAAWQQLHAATATYKSQKQQKLLVKSRSTTQRTTECGIKTPTVAAMFSFMVSDWNGANTCAHAHRCNYMNTRRSLQASESTSDKTVASRGRGLARWLPRLVLLASKTKQLAAQPSVQDDCHLTLTQTNTQ